MVSDDDTEPREPFQIHSQPVEFRDPEDEDISRAVRHLAQQHARWGPRRILETLRDNGLKLEQAEVNYVLRKHGLPNLHL